MKRQCLIIPALACLYMLLASPASAAPAEEAAAGPRPQMTIETPFFNMGDISPGSLVQHEFILKNQGTADLELQDVRPSCGCTVASYDKIIAPGAEGKVLLKVRVYQEWAGQDISKSVWLVSNDPEFPQSTLTLSGRVLPHGTDGGKPPLSAQ